MKKKTKDRILETALQLFNTDGLSQVTLRTIANEMGISQGNLNYHFRKREDIIEALYHQLVANINESMNKVENAKNPIELMYDISATTMKNFYDYRFFLLDFVQIMRENETIRQHYAELTKLREQQFSEIFQLLITHGLIREEQLPNEYYHLYKRLQIIGDFWISSASIESLSLNQETIEKYTKIMNEAIYPYLTDAGKKMYQLP